MYAILDIETTGGQFNEEGITEIAIYKFDGSEIVDQFISLINPEKPIQPFVIKLTGINNEMLVAAPKFYEIAKRIVEITQDCILVAHNSQFDYRILRTEFKRLGYDFKLPTLCTVEMSKKLIPEMPSYSLGKLVRSLGIPLTDRHRASGDALATVKLFKLLLSKDTSKEIVQLLVKTEIEKGLHPKMLDIIAKVPSTVGVFYAHNQEGKIIYISRATNIKRKLNQILIGQSTKHKKIQVEIFDVSYQETGTELIAMLMENQDILHNKPKYNRGSRSITFNQSIYQELDKDGYLSLQIQKTNRAKQEVFSFINAAKAQSFLYKITEKYELCQKINLLERSADHCFPFTINECRGACVFKEDTIAYNTRVEEVLEKYNSDKNNTIIIDKGRNSNEKSAILIQNNVVLGYAFFDLNFQVSSIEILQNILTKLDKNPEYPYLIKTYYDKKKALKTISF